MADEIITGTREPGGTGRPPGSEEQKEWARKEAEHLKEELQGKGESLLNDQKAAMVAVLDGLANGLDKSAPHFEEEGQPNTARYTRLAAENLHRLSADLRERDLETISREVSDFGRRQPGLLVGGAVALGFVASRFLRSSAEHAPEQYAGERQSEESDEELIIGADAGFRSGDSGSARAAQTEPSSPILTEKEAREAEKDLPR